jgi:hypothetical protein
VRRQGRELYALNLTRATHPFISLVNELAAWTPELQADRRKLAQMEIAGALRADGSKLQSEEPSRASEAGGREKPDEFASGMVRQAA